MTTIMEELEAIEEMARKHELLVQGQTDEQGNEEPLKVQDGPDDWRYAD